MDGNGSNLELWQWMSWETFECSDLLNPQSRVQTCNHTETTFSWKLSLKDVIWCLRILSKFCVLLLFWEYFAKNSKLIVTWVTGIHGFLFNTYLSDLNSLLFMSNLCSEFNLTGLVIGGKCLSCISQIGGGILDRRRYIKHRGTVDICRHHGSNWWTVQPSVEYFVNIILDY